METTLMLTEHEATITGLFILFIIAVPLAIIFAITSTNDRPDY